MKTHWFRWKTHQHTFFVKVMSSSVFGCVIFFSSVWISSNLAILCMLLYVNKLLLLLLLSLLMFPPRCFALWQRVHHSSVSFFKNPLYTCVMSFYFLWISSVTWSCRWSLVQPHHFCMCLQRKVKKKLYCVALQCQSVNMKQLNCQMDFHWIWFYSCVTKMWLCDFFLIGQQCVFLHICHDWLSKYLLKQKKVAGKNETHILCQVPCFCVSFGFQVNWT
jgi:hypothetical protein